MINKKKVEIKEEVEKIVSITCDICGKTYMYDTENDDIFEIQEFIHIKNNCGYGSIFGDGDTVELDMCQHCFKEKLGQYIRIIED